MAQKQCGECGTQLTESAKRCHRCGIRIMSPKEATGLQTTLQNSKPTYFRRP
jgi:ribosomal protein L40E